MDSKRRIFFSIFIFSLTIDRLSMGQVVCCQQQCSPMLQKIIAYKLLFSEVQLIDKVQDMSLCTEQRLVQTLGIVVELYVDSVMLYPCTL